MKRLIIIGEGATEQEFCKGVLAPYFYSKGIRIENPKIRASRGGIVPWPKLKDEIEIYLKNDTNAYVTLLIDYYGLYDKHYFPCWEEAHKEATKAECVSVIELGMKEEVNKKLSDRFIPYIQLHELEALIFSDPSVVLSNFEESEFKNIEYLDATLKEFPNPEDINNNKQTAPSKRLERIFRNYRKVVFGSLLLEEIGLPKIRKKCPRFNAWIQELESI
ncbi:DUF4276 family protein [Cytophagaceae bacterium ABcell3]|nr:DUF4276 family protein [Cytophagaceae bacterium ABcell3]